MSNWQKQTKSVIDDDDDDELTFYVRQTIKNNIFFAARDGLSIALHSLLSNINSVKLQNTIINQEFFEDSGETFTPLVIAARNGRFNAVKTLLNSFKPNIEQECIVKFDDNIIHGATALWCAAASGYLNIVKLLVQNGANVNHPTKTLSTPLRAACFDGRLDIVKYLVCHKADINIANIYNNTCLMISAYKGHIDIVEFLLNYGANPDEAAHCGATAMHYAAECGHLEICKLLLSHGATLKTNEYNMTPVLVAAERIKEYAVRFFIDANLLTTEEEIDALELLGASFANDKDNYFLSQAYHYLMIGMELRYKDSNNIIKKPLCVPIPAYENWIECKTINDLQAIRYNHNSIHMEALAIRERILTRKCPDLAHQIVYRGAICADNNRFDRCEALWLHALMLRQNNKLSVQRDLLRFAQVFSQMLHLNVKLSLKNVIIVLSACIAEIQRNKDKLNCPGPKDDLEVVLDEYESNIITSLYLLTITTKLLSNPDEQLYSNDNDNSNDDMQNIDNTKNIYKLVYKLNKMDVALKDGQTLLHLAVNGVTPIDDYHTNDICRFPCVDTVKLLLHCGAQVSTVDFDRNTPLHTLIANLDSIDIIYDLILPIITEITKLFVDAGVHLDAINRDGLTAAQLSNSVFIESFIRQFEVRDMCLRCLASRCIAEYKIKYKGIVPKHLESYIQMHCAGKI